MTNKLRIVTSFAPKGGVGKTAILMSLGNYLDCVRGMRVSYVDTDQQGATLADLGLRTHWGSFDIMKKATLRDQVAAEGFHKIQDEGYKNSSVLFYPTEMFCDDAFSADAGGLDQLISTYRNAVCKELKKGDVVLLIDGRPPTLSTSAVLPMACLDDLVDSYSILIPTRALESEIAQGFAAYEQGKALMLRQGVNPAKIKAVHVVNFVPAKNIYAKQEYEMLVNERDIVISSSSVFLPCIL